MIKFKNQLGESYQLGPAASAAAPVVALASASDPPPVAQSTME
jgi:hypothetical protein